MLRKRMRTRGVTLIEMIVVLAIIVILAGISTPNFLIMVKNNRVRARTVAVLAALRNERSRAISLNREVRFTIDNDAKTYNVTRLGYIQYDPLSPDPNHPVILNVEDPEVLILDEPFDPGNWLLENTEDEDKGVEVAPDPFEVTFTPSGTIRISGVAVGSLKLKGQHIGYEIQLYKGGQIDIFGL